MREWVFALLVARGNEGVARWLCDRYDPTVDAFVVKVDLEPEDALACLRNQGIDVEETISKALCSH